jgi:hypothetical protein
MSTAGPEAASFPTGCWHSALIETLILREFGVLYTIHYVSELLRNLGFSYQKARFVSDHLNDEKRAGWLTKTWPSIVQTARQKGALLLFGDEASFAQRGRWATPGRYGAATRGEDRRQA